MKLPRRNFLHLAAGAATLPAMQRFAWAQAYPTRPVKIVVPVGPREPCFYLAARPLLPQHDRATPIQTHDVKQVFADIDTDHGDFRIGFG